MSEKDSAVRLLKCGCYQLDREVTRRAIARYLKKHPNHNWREMRHDVKACIRDNAASPAVCEAVQ